MDEGGHWIVFEVQTDTETDYSGSESDFVYELAHVHDDENINVEPDELQFNESEFNEYLIVMMFFLWCFGLSWKIFAYFLSRKVRIELQ